MDSGMFYGIQKGATAALKLPYEWILGMNDTYKKRRDLVWNICDILKCTYKKDNVGMFVWAKIPKGKNAGEITDDLLYKYDVFITPGTVFGSAGEGFVRFSLCVPEEKIEIVLNRLK